eukprot:12900855-Heterocapsa_arctica.AAC.1
MALTPSVLDSAMAAMREEMTTMITKNVLSSMEKVFAKFAAKLDKMTTTMGELYEPNKVMVLDSGFKDPPELLKPNKAIYNHDTGFKDPPELHKLNKMM